MPYIILMTSTDLLETLKASTDTVPSWVMIWYFPTIGLKLNLDLILSGSGSAGNEVTGGFPFTAGVTIGDIEGVNTNCFHLGSVAYGRR